MKAFLLGIVVLCLWAIPVRYYYVCKIKKHCDNTVEAPVKIKERPRTLALNLGDSTLIQGQEQFFFETGSTYPDLTNNNRQWLDTLAGRLLADTSMQVLITAAFRPSEEQMKQGFFKNIGLARANTIKNLLNQRGVKEEQLQLFSQKIMSEDLDEPLRFEVQSELDQ